MLRFRFSGLPCVRINLKVVDRFLRGFCELLPKWGGLKTVSRGPETLHDKPLRKPIYSQIYTDNPESVDTFP